MFETIIYEKINKYAVLTFNRAEQRNAINHTMRCEIIAALGEAKEDPEVRCVVLKAEGKSFCAGRDINDVRAMSDRPITEVVADWEKQGELLNAFHDFPKPLVAAVQGHALGFGCSILTYCDLVVSDEKAVFGFPEINLNIVPGIASVNAARIISKRKFTEMIMLGKKFGPAEAEQIGIINTVVEDNTAFETAKAWAEQISGIDPTTMALSKKFIRTLGSGEYSSEMFSSLGVMTMGFAHKGGR